MDGDSTCDRKSRHYLKSLLRCNIWGHQFQNDCLFTRNHPIHPDTVLALLDHCLVSDVQQVPERLNEEVYTRFFHEVTENTPEN